VGKKKEKMLAELSSKEARILDLELRNTTLLQTIADTVAENRRLTLVISNLRGGGASPSSSSAKPEITERGDLQQAILQPIGAKGSRPSAALPIQDSPTAHPVNHEDNQIAEVDSSNWLAPKRLAAINAEQAPEIIINPSNLFHRGFHITDEQQHSVDLVDKGGSLKIEAGAGTGKTSDLIAISYQQRHRNGIYLAFGRQVVDDAKAVFHHKTKCLTHHGLAYRALGHQYDTRLKSRLTSTHVVKALNLQDFQHLSCWTVAAVIMSWISKFAQGADDEIGPENAPWEILLALTKEGEREKARIIAASYVAELQPLVVTLWHKLVDLNSLLPINPDIYLKAWALTLPRIETDYILFDEAQDASGVMMKIIHDQDTQNIWVGDRRQQIFAWRGAVNAMDKIQTDNVCTLTRSFRYGQPVAELANCVLRNFLHERDFFVVGNPSVKSVIGKVKNPSAFICRTNRTAIGELMRALRQGKRVHMVGGVQELLYDIESAQSLMEGGRPRSPSLQVFNTWGELVEYARSEVGSDLSPLVKMLDMWPAKTLLKALNQIKDVKEAEADLVISTAHRAKGKEYPSVKLGGDFPWPSSPNKECKHSFSPEDANLLYVAITRAKYELDISDCMAAQVALEGSF
jgi:superfamily I DNA/RNA helicase